MSLVRVLCQMASLLLLLAGCAVEDGALFGDWNYAFTPDRHFTWAAPARAAGVVVWAHGNAGPLNDARTTQTPLLLRPFNQAGFDVVRFDRAPAADQRDRAAGWLRDGLQRLRAAGFKTVIVAGQSRGGWNALQMLDTPGLADAVIALSPAAHGSGASPNLLGQSDDLRALLSAVRPGRTRLVVAQFQGDLFIGDAATRAAAFRQIQPRLGALLLIDRPDGLAGHQAGTGSAFGDRYAQKILMFCTQPPVLPQQP